MVGKEETKMVDYSASSANNTQRLNETVALAATLLSVETGDWQAGATVISVERQARQWWQEDHPHGPQWSDAGEIARDRYRDLVYRRC
jgi:hypothetical protein